MKIGMIGCGKLGLMVALAIENKGHDVIGYDTDSKIEEYLQKKKIPFKEEHADKLLANTKMRIVSLKELIYQSEIIFIAVQTPHEPLYEGITRLPNIKADFDYSYLKESVKQVNDCLNNIKEDRIIVIISTVLPGTIDREIIPLMGPYFKLVYEPLFIAMGTVYQDYLNPEFVLVGVDDKQSDDKQPKQSINKLEEFYKTIHNAPIFKTDIRTAETIKVFYNTFITSKIVLANIYGEMAHKLGANVDDIYNALSMCSNRIISSKYLKAGMGDGGACHPRDNIALSFIAEKIGLSYNIFDTLMKARETHIEWLSDVIIEKHKEYGLPIIILGKTFKPESNIILGSSAILLSNIMKEKGIDHIAYDPYIDRQKEFKDRAVYFIATMHDIFSQMKFRSGSIIIDPFRYIPDQENIEVIRIGNNANKILLSL